MTADDEAPSTEAEFRADLRSLLRRAHEEDIDIEGGWECRNGTEHPDWDVVVSEVQKPTASE
ncbi:hypothetical protein [Halorubrum pallidum]